MPCLPPACDTASRGSDLGVLSSPSAEFFRLIHQIATLGRRLKFTSSARRVLGRFLARVSQRHLSDFLPSPFPPTSDPTHLSSSSPEPAWSGQQTAATARGASPGCRAPGLSRPSQSVPGPRDSQRARVDVCLGHQSESLSPLPPSCRRCTFSSKQRGLPAVFSDPQLRPLHSPDPSPAGGPAAARAGVRGLFLPRVLAPPPLHLMCLFFFNCKISENIEV